MVLRRGFVGRGRGWLLAPVVGASLVAGNVRAEGDLITLITPRGVKTEPFAANSGDVLDQCITTGSHKVFRFDFNSRNIGNGDIVAGSAPPPVCTTCPCGSTPTNGNFIWSDSHCHWHLKNFNNYALLTPSGAAAATGFKQAFCLMDFNQWSSTAGPRVYDCSNQGVSPGWEDIYDHTLSCQFINVDGVADGDYRIVATTNAAPTVTEANIHNNTISVPVHIAGESFSTINAAWQPRETATATGTTFLPGLASWGPNRLDAFWSSTTLKHYFKGGATWSATDDRGAPSGVTLSSSPSAVSWGPNRIDVFVKGSDSKLWHLYWNGTAWGPWDNPSGASSVWSAPAVVSWGPNRLDAFYADTVGNIETINWNGTGWSSMTNLGHPSGVTFSESTTAVAWGVNHLDFFVRGSDNKLWHNFWNGSIWVGWDNPASVSGMSTRPSVTSWQPNRLDIFWGASSTNSLKHLAWNGAAWGTIDDLGAPSGVTIGSAWPSSVAWGPSRLDVFVKGSDNKLWHTYWGGVSFGGWDAPYSNTDLVSSPQAVSWAAGQVGAVFGVTGGNLGAASFF